jgi:DegV family protein with EDD domain
MDAKTFYRRLRDGEMATTSAINPGQYVEYLTPILAGGQDVLLLVFSSGLSSTYQNSLLAAEELRAQFPDRKLYVVDTLAPSGGQALLVYHAALRRQEGASLEETRDWVEENKLHLAHWFTVDDLMFLKRGGRISAATAVMGSMLSIKPVLHVDDAGHLVNVSKARGRRASLRALVDKMEQTAIHPENQTVFIGHGDCLEDAQWVAEEVRRRFGTRSIYIAYTCPIIGTHSGPGTLALFFLAFHR